MLGKSTAEIKSYLHDQLEVFGCMEADTDKFLGAVIHQAIIAGYLDKEIENYGLLKVTKAGHSFLKNPKSFKIVEDKEFNEDDEDVTIKSGGVCAVDPELYSILKDLRKSCQEAGVAAVCNLSRHLVGGYGYNISNHNGRTSNYTRRWRRQGETL